MGDKMPVPNHCCSSGHGKIAWYADTYDCPLCVMREKVWRLEQELSELDVQIERLTQDASEVESDIKID